MAKVIADGYMSCLPCHILTVFANTVEYKCVLYLEILEDVGWGKVVEVVAGKVGRLVVVSAVVEMMVGGSTEEIFVEDLKPDCLRT